MSLWRQTSEKTVGVFNWRNYILGEISLLHYTEKCSRYTSLFIHMSYCCFHDAWAYDRLYIFGDFPEPFAMGLMTIANKNGQFLHWKQYSFQNAK